MRHRSVIAKALAVIITMAGCASMPMDKPATRDLAGSGMGVLEFYCASCVTGWAVYEVVDGREVRILNQDFGRNALDLLNNPVRMRHTGIQHAPGEIALVVRLLPSALRTQSISREVQVSVAEATITPIRIDARKHTHESIEWEVVVGPALPVSNDAASVERLQSALRDSDWGVRWYAAEAIAHLEAEVASELRAGLDTLASDDEYQECLDNEGTVPCSLVSEQAKDVLRQIGKGNMK